MTASFTTTAKLSQRLITRVRSVLLVFGVFVFALFSYTAGYLSGFEVLSDRLTATWMSEDALFQMVILSYTPTFLPTQTPSPSPPGASTPTLTLTLTPTCRLTPTLTPSPTKTQSPTPTETPPESGFSLISASQLVSLGELAEVVIRTQPGVSCSLVYLTPSGRESTAAGVGRLTADSDGYCRWLWKIGSSTRPGQGTLRLNAGGQTEVYSIKITN